MTDVPFWRRPPITYPGWAVLDHADDEVRKAHLKVAKLRAATAKFRALAAKMENDMKHDQLLTELGQIREILEDAHKPPTNTTTTCQLCSALVAAKEEKRHLGWHHEQAARSRRYSCRHSQAVPVSEDMQRQGGSPFFCPDCRMWLDALDR